MRGDEDGPGKLPMDLPEPDLAAGILAGYRALLVGSEAHEKNFAGLRESPQRLLDFVTSGGRVVIFQLQDSSYQTHYLARPWRPAMTRRPAARS